MKTAPGICFVACFLLAGQVVMQVRAQAQPTPAQPQVAPQPAPSVVVKPTDKKEARGLYLSSDGSLVGRVTFIDPTSLELKPIPGTTVTFMKNRQVVSRVQSDANGMFVMQGLVPNSVYSVFVTSPEWIAIFSTVVRPFDPAAVAQQAVADRSGKRINELRLVSQLVEVGAPQDVISVAEGSAIQAVPRGDFATAMQDGVVGGEPVEGGVVMGGVPMAVGGFGGGGGGGFGGGGLGGIGGALGAVGLALGIAALAEDEEAPTPVSPIMPE